VIEIFLKSTPHPRVTLSASPHISIGNKSRVRHAFPVVRLSQLRHQGRGGDESRATSQVPGVLNPPDDVVEGLDVREKASTDSPDCVIRIEAATSYGSGSGSPRAPNPLMT
jgi:hypothetical protein